MSIPYGWEDGKPKASTNLEKWLLPNPLNPEFSNAGREPDVELGAQLLVCSPWSLKPSFISFR